MATVLLLWSSLRGADAAAAPGIADGLAWLAAQVTTTGTLIREAESLALPEQSRPETALTLALAGAAPAPLLAGLAGPPSPAEPTEFLARRILALQAAGRPEAAGLEHFDAWCTATWKPSARSE